MQTAAFTADIRRALGDDAEYRVDEGVLVVRGRPGTYGMGNLFDAWRGCPEAERTQLVSHHLSTIFDAMDENARRPPGTAPAGILRPRLWPAEMAADPRVDVLARPLADGLAAVLVVDQPTSVVTLTTSGARTLEEDPERLWTQAIAQIDDGLAVTEDTARHGVRLLWGASHFVASRVLDLERFIGPLPPAGAVVAVPTRSTLMLRALSDSEVVAATSTMALTARRTHDRGPGGISPHLYWWRPGPTFVHLPAVVSDSGVVIEPPEEFIEALDDLPG